MSLKKVFCCFGWAFCLCLQQNPVWAQQRGEEAKTAAKTVEEQLEKPLQEFFGSGKWPEWMDMHDQPSLLRQSFLGPKPEQKDSKETAIQQTQVGRVDKILFRCWDAQCKRQSVLYVNEAYAVLSAALILRQPAADTNDAKQGTEMRVVIFRKPLTFGTDIEKPLLDWIHKQEESESDTRITRIYFQNFDKGFRGLDDIDY